MTMTNRGEGDRISGKMMALAILAIVPVFSVAIAITLPMDKEYESRTVGMANFSIQDPFACSRSHA